MRHSDISRGRVIIDRWRVLAEARLSYLTELYETDRWPRYFSERAFLENFREAKAAVETWRVLASQQALPDNTPLDLSWLDARRPVPVPQPPMITAQPVRMSKPRAEPVAAISMPPLLRSGIEVAPRAPAVVAAPPADVAPRAPAVDWKLGLDLSRLKQRYSLLRNAV